MDNNNDMLKGKRILFFAPTFFSYEKMIADEMSKMGASVDYYNVRSITSAIGRGINKILPLAFSFQAKAYYKNILSQVKRKEYDYIFFIKCDMTPHCILKQLKTIFPKAKMCLYLYDSVRNIPGVQTKFKYFDSLHSFDLNDCKKYARLKFRPLFFGEQYSSNVSVIAKPLKYDICFLGTVHSDRFFVIKKVQQIAKKKGLRCYWFLFLQSKMAYWFYRFTKKEFKGMTSKQFNYKSKTPEEIARIINSSRAVLDIQHPRQTGLTMRTIEMIGMRKKIITTNKSIVKYDFYNPNNIMVIDRNNPMIDSSFFDKPYFELPKEIYDKYSIKKWILDCLQ